MKVAVYRSEAFKVSETFIYSQFERLSNLEKVFVFREISESSAKGLSTLVGNRYLKIRRSVFNRIGKRIFKKCVDMRFVDSIKKNGITALVIHFGTEAHGLKEEIQSLGIPCYIVLHGYDVSIRQEYWRSLGSTHPLFKYHEDLVSLSDFPNVKFVTISNRITAKAISLGIPECKINQLPIGVDVDSFQGLNHKQGILLFVGRLVEKKNIAAFMDICRELTKRNSKLSFVVIGDGEDRHSMTNHDQFPNILWLGACEHDVVKDYIGKSKYFILPSRTARNGDTEGLPISVLEAMAAKCIVFYGVDDGFSEPIIDGENGFVLRERLDETADIILKLEQDFVLADSIAKNARDYVKAHYELQACSDRLRDFICEEQ